MRNIIKSTLILIALVLSSSLKAQELLCTIEVNSQQVEGSSKSVFETLQEAMNEYVNNRKWTNTNFSNNEKIECRMFFHH